MPSKKMRVELFDTEGNRYTVTFEGQVTKEKALQLLDLVELLGGVPSEGNTHNINPSLSQDELSKYERVNLLLNKHFPFIWFSSRETQSAYEKEFKEPISLSTIATYLSRLGNKGKLLKAGPPNRLKYKLAQTFPQPTLKHRIS